MSNRRLSLAARDFVEGLKSWRIWWLLGTNDVRQRYHRSFLGQFWVTANVAVFIGMIGTVNAVLFQSDVKDYLPFLAVSYVAWLFLSSLVSDATGMFTQAEGLMRQEALPRTVFLMRILVRSLATLGHNALIVPVVLLIFGVPVSWTAALALVGILLSLLAGAPIALLVGMVCARFRDVPVIIQNLVLMAFFLSPVLWKPAMLRNELEWLVAYNPFAIFLRLISEPVFGTVPDATLYIKALAIFVVSTLIAAWALARYRHRIIYWL